MDREYIQYLKQEATASATRAISRAIAVSIYGVVGVYLLSTIMSGVLPKVAAILPLGSNAMGSQDEGGMDLYRADIWAHDDGDGNRFLMSWWGEDQIQQLCSKMGNRQVSLVLLENNFYCKIN